MKINWHQIKSYVKHCFIAKRNGHGVHSPFAYQLCEEVFYNHHSFYVFDKLNLIRKQVLVDKTKIKMQDHGAGSKVFSKQERSIKNIAAKGISSQYQSEIIFKMINFLKAKNCLELGSSIGLNTLYMASVNSAIQVTSVDACEDLINYANQLAERNHYNNIEFICSTFDAALPNILSQKIDFIYIDGNHTYESTMKYFELILLNFQPSTVIVFDDIYWSEGMTKAWEEIKANPKLTLSIDTFHQGFVFFKEEIKEKIDLRFLLM
jgi:predicted O-methyltransferase YrrM